MRVFKETKLRKDNYLATVQIRVEEWDDHGRDVIEYNVYYKLEDTDYTPPKLKREEIVTPKSFRFDRYDEVVPHFQKTIKTLEEQWFRMETPEAGHRPAINSAEVGKWYVDLKDCESQLVKKDDDLEDMAVRLRSWQPSFGEPWGVLQSTKLEERHFKAYLRRDKLEKQMAELKANIQKVNEMFCTPSEGTGGCGVVSE